MSATCDPWTANIEAGYNAVRMRTQPTERTPPGDHLSYVTVGSTQAGYTVHERRADKRRLLAVFADHDDAWWYAKRRAKLPWRVLKRPDKRVTSKLPS